MKLSLLVVCALAALLIPALRMPARAGEPTPTLPWNDARETIIANMRLTATLPPFQCPSWSSYCPQDPTKTPEPTSVVPPYPAPEINELPPYPEPLPEVKRHVTCIVIPWMGEDGWKKREVCYPNR